MKNEVKFNSLAAAENYIKSLNIPDCEIDKVEKLPQINLPFYMVLKHADCDIIRINYTFEDERLNYKPVWIVQKRWYSAPISASECFGMLPQRYKTPDFI